jgi:hypothetical protein
MPGLYGLTRDFYAYISDDTNTYVVALTDNDAVSGGFGDAVAANAYPGYPRGWKMRIQYGVSGDGIRTKIPVSDPTSAIWTSPSEFTKNAIEFVAEGSRGEKRFTRS